MSKRIAAVNEYLANCDPKHQTPKGYVYATIQNRFPDSDMDVGEHLRQKQSSENSLQSY